MEVAFQDSNACARLKIKMWQSMSERITIKRNVYFRAQNRIEAVFSFLAEKRRLVLYTTGVAPTLIPRITVEDAKNWILARHSQITQEIEERIKFHRSLKICDSDRESECEEEEADNAELCWPAWSRMTMDIFTEVYLQTDEHYDDPNGERVVD